MDDTQSLDGHSIVVTYNAYPTTARFHRSSAKHRFLGGTQGCGKTAAMIVDSRMYSEKQQPYFNHEYPDGCRHTRHAFLRRTQGEIRESVMSELPKWLPGGLRVMKNSLKAEAEYVLESDKTTVKIEYFFFGADDDESMSQFDSRNFTNVYMNEAHHFTRTQRNLAQTRCRRFPKELYGVNCTNGSFAGDFNPPAKDHWIAEDYIYSHMTGMDGEITSEIFMVPPPIVRTVGNRPEIKGSKYYNGFTYYRNPLDEVCHLHAKKDEITGERLTDGSEFWLDSIDGLTENEIRQRILGVFQTSTDGKAVYEKFSTDKHLSPVPIVHQRHKVLYVAFDWGHHAACTMGQVLECGTLAMLREHYHGAKGLDYMMKESVMPSLLGEFKGYALDITYDPSNKKQEGELDLKQSERVAEYLDKEGIKYRMTPAKNEWADRRNSLEYILEKDNGIIFDPSMKITRQGMDGEYAYPKRKGKHEGTYESKPDKDSKYSHTIDTVEYIVQRLVKTIRDRKRFQSRTNSIRKRRRAR